MSSRWNPRRKDEKEKYVETFNIKNWKEMAHAEKKQAFVFKLPRVLSSLC